MVTPVSTAVLDLSCHLWFTVEAAVEAGAEGTAENPRELTRQALEGGAQVPSTHVDQHDH